MPDVLFSCYGRVGVITLNRPEKLNAFADRMRQELVEITSSAAADDSVGALVVTGAGRAFCAGADVGYLYELVCREDWDALDALVDAGARVVAVIDGLEKPVLAAVNGAAAGGGANLALACDVRVAAASASIGQTFNRIGLQPDWGGTYFLSRTLSIRPSSWMLADYFKDREKYVSTTTASATGCVLPAAISSSCKSSGGRRSQSRLPSERSGALPMARSRTPSISSADISVCCSEPPKLVRACGRFSKHAEQPEKVEDI